MGEGKRGERVGVERGEGRGREGKRVERVGEERLIF